MNYLNIYYYIRLSLSNTGRVTQHSLYYNSGLPSNIKCLHVLHAFEQEVGCGLCSRQCATSRKTLPGFLLFLHTLTVYLSVTELCLYHLHSQLDIAPCSGKYCYKPEFKSIISNAFQCTVNIAGGINCFHQVDSWRSQLQSIIVELCDLNWKC